MALALVLLLGSGLLLRSLAGVLAVNPGFRPEGVLAAKLVLTDSRYDSEAQRHAFVRTLLDNVRGLPGVESAGTTNAIPLTQYSIGLTVRREGDPPPAPGNGKASAVLVVSPGYLSAMGVRLRRGRLFGDELAAVVNLQFARSFFGTEDVVGKRIQFPGLPEATGWYTIVGLIDNVHHKGREARVDSEVYVPESQIAIRRVHIVLRTKGDPLRLVPGLRAAVWSIDKDLPVSDISTMEERLSRNGAGRRLQTLLLSAFAFLAMCLAAVGIYGVVSELVNRRTREIGLRMALGACAGDVLRMVMARSFLLAMTGIVVGVIAGAYLVRFLSSQLFGIKATDTLTFVSAAVVLLAAALLAGYLPARRAVRIDPVAALRCE